MTILDRLFPESPFKALTVHTQKVHACVELVRPLVDALLEGDSDKILELHDTMSKTEHEADVVKTEIREGLSTAWLLSVKRDDLSRYLAYQDDVADAAEDFAVILSLRKTEVHPELREDLKAFADQVINVSETLLEMANHLVTLSQTGFSGGLADTVLHGTTQLGEEEWKADRLQRKFARHCYALEDQLDPMTLFFYDKMCATLSDIANKAENTGKFLHMLVAHR
jgi:hypothetical protein